VAISLKMAQAASKSGLSIKGERRIRLGEVAVTADLDRSVTRVGDSKRNDRPIWFCINDRVRNECALAVFHCNKEGASLGSATQNPNGKKNEWPKAHYSPFSDPLVAHFCDCCCVPEFHFVQASLHLFNVTGAAPPLFHFR